MKTSGPASTGLTFIWMPQLFARMMFGSPLAVLFFLGLTFAGFSSLIAQLELPTRVLVDTGMKRTNAIWIMVAVVYLLGIPSARNLNILSNQDFVWSVALMLSGAFIAFAIIKEGVRKLMKEINVTENDWSVGAYWNITIRLFIPFAAFLLLFWWLFLSATVFAPGEWYNPLNPFSVMTCLVQWFLVTAIFVGFNRRIARNTIG
jgi:NSS family neurotransmitter:Na+ symporter